MIYFEWSAAKGAAFGIRGLLKNLDQNFSVSAAYTCSYVLSAPF